VHEKCYEIYDFTGRNVLKLPLIEHPVGARGLLVEHLLEIKGER